MVHGTAVLAAWLTMPAALAAAGSGGPARASGAVGATAPATMPAAVPPERVEALVAQLASRRYEVRRAAQQELRRIVDVPGVAGMLKAHRAAAADTETQVALAGLVDAFDQPLAVIWCQTYLVASGSSYRQGSQPRAAPWLFIGGDGGFVLDAGGPLATGKDDSDKSDFRQGTLTPEQLWRVKKTIDGTGLARRIVTAQPAPPRGKDGAWWGVTLHLRSGEARRTSVHYWDGKELSPGRRPAGADEAARLAVWLRDYLAGLRGQPYQGPMTMFATHIYVGTSSLSVQPRMDRKDVENLPDWPVKDVEPRKATGLGGLPLTGEQLAAVQAALKRGNTFKVNRHQALRVGLAPDVAEARRLFLGEGRR